MNTSSRCQFGQVEIEFKTSCFVIKFQVFLLKTIFVSIENAHILFNVHGLGFVFSPRCHSPSYIPVGATRAVHPLPSEGTFIENVSEQPVFSGIFQLYS